MKTYKLKINGKDYQVDIRNFQDDYADVTCDGAEYHIEFEKKKTVRKQNIVERKPASPLPAQSKTRRPSSPGSNSIQAPIPGLMTAILVKAGDTVEAGQIVAKMEAMKMENNIYAPGDSVIAEIMVAVSDSILEGDVIMTLEEK